MFDEENDYQSTPNKNTAAMFEKNLDQMSSSQLLYFYIAKFKFYLFLYQIEDITDTAEKSDSRLQRLNR